MFKCKINIIIMPTTSSTPNERTDNVNHRTRVQNNRIHEINRVRQMQLQNELNNDLLNEINNNLHDSNNNYSNYSSLNRYLTSSSFVEMELVDILGNLCGNINLNSQLSDNSSRMINSFLNSITKINDNMRNSSTDAFLINAYNNQINNGYFTHIDIPRISHNMTFGGNRRYYTNQQNRMHNQSQTNNRPPHYIEVINEAPTLNRNTAANRNTDANRNTVTNRNTRNNNANAGRRNITINRPTNQPNNRQNNTWSSWFNAPMTSRSAPITFSTRTQYPRNIINNLDNIIVRSFNQQQPSSSLGLSLNEINKYTSPVCKRYIK